MGTSQYRVWHQADMTWQEEHMPLSGVVIPLLLKALTLTADSRTLLRVLTRRIDSSGDSRGALILRGILRSVVTDTRLS